MKTQQTILICLSAFLFSCNSGDNRRTTAEVYSKPFDSTANYKGTGSIQTTESNGKKSHKEMDSLLKQWTWNDKMTRPLKSAISNATYSSDLLLKTWTWSDDDETQPALTFKRDSLTIHGEKKYIYTINYDSLRIFTSYDHPGDGFTRGIITKLTKDSMIIKWSTEDMNKYVPVKTK